MPASTANAPRETYPTVYSQEYESQFLTHATMEPMNCTARVSGDTVEIWAPTQGQEMTRITLASVFNLPKENIQVSRTLLGGGFGRRLVANDFALQSAVISKAVGRPVKVIWSREEDMQHDIYRPATLHRITAGINEYGKLRAIAHRLVSPSILQYVYQAGVTDVYDSSCLEGLLETHYEIPNIRVDFKLLHVPVPTSVLRTTGYGPNIFAWESFVDELGSRKGIDGYHYRRDLLSNSPRSLAVLDLVAQKSNWETPAPKGPLPRHRVRRCVWNAHRARRRTLCFKRPPSKDPQGRLRSGSWNGPRSGHHREFPRRRNWLGPFMRFQIRNHLRSRPHGAKQLSRLLHYPHAGDAARRDSPDQ
jgi:isoquinoline 1-oxidoreductase beta subunit